MCMGLYMVILYYTHKHIHILHTRIFPYHFAAASSAPFLGIYTGFNGVLLFTLDPVLLSLNSTL